MDFSSKQAMGVIVVIGIAALVVAAAIVLTRNNNKTAGDESKAMIDKVHKEVTNSNGSTGAGSGIVDTTTGGE